MSAVSSFENGPLLRLRVAALSKFKFRYEFEDLALPARCVGARNHRGTWLALYWTARFCISSPLVRFDRPVFDVLALPVPFRNHACRKRRQTRAGARCCLVG